MMTDVETRQGWEYEAASVRPPAKPPNLSSWKQRTCAVVLSHRGCYLLSKKVNGVEYLSEAGQLLWVAQKWGEKESGCPRKRVGEYLGMWVTVFTQGVSLKSVWNTQAIRLASPCAVLMAFKPSGMRAVPGVWHGWRIYFSYKAEGEVLTARTYSRADGTFCTERAKDLCPVWTHNVLLQFPWHFPVLGPNNCSVLVLNSKWFQLRHSGMTRPVTKCSLVLT